MCSVYPGQPWGGAASGSWNHQSPDSTPSTLLPSSPAQCPPASSRSPDTLRAEGDPFPSGISDSLHPGLGDGSLLGCVTSQRIRNWVPQTQARGGGSPPGSERKGSPPRENFRPRKSCPAGTGKPASRLPPQEGLVSEDLCQPGVERPVEVPQKPLGNRQHGPQIPVLGTPRVGRRALGHQGLLLLT